VRKAYSQRSTYNKAWEKHLLNAVHTTKRAEIRSAASHNSPPPSLAV